jgi:hypothetical protein
LDLLKDIRDFPKNIKVKVISTRSNSFDRYPSLKEVTRDYTSIDVRDISINKKDLLDFLRYSSTEISNKFENFLKYRIEDVIEKVFRKISDGTLLTPLSIIMWTKEYIKNFEPAAESLNKIDQSSSLIKGSKQELKTYFSFLLDIYHYKFQEREDIKKSFQEYFFSLSKLGWHKYLEKRLQTLSTSNDPENFKSFHLQLEIEIGSIRTNDLFSDFISVLKNDYIFMSEKYLSFFASSYMFLTICNPNSTDDQIKWVLGIQHLKDITEYFSSYFQEFEDLKGYFNNLECCESIDNIVSRLIKLYKKIGLVISNESSIPSVNTVTKREMAYILGRIPNTQARNELVKLYTEFKEILLNKGIDDEQLKNIIFELRNISVGLMKQNNEEIEKEYFQRINKNEMERVVNLQFHLYYYLDFPYVPWYKIPISGLTFKQVENTFRHLINHLDAFISNQKHNGTYIKLPLYTLTQIMKACTKNEDTIPNDIIKSIADIFIRIVLIETFQKDNLPNYNIFTSIENDFFEFVKDHSTNIQKTVIFLVMKDNYPNLNKYESRNLNVNINEYLNRIIEKKEEYEYIFSISELLLNIKNEME